MGRATNIIVGAMLAVIALLGVWVMVAAAVRGADLPVPRLHRPVLAPPPFWRGLSIFTPPEHRPMGVAIGKDPIRQDKHIEGAAERPAGMP